MSATESNAYSPARRQVFIHWVWEIFFLVTATGILGAISGILIIRDGTFLSDWRFPINLNTFIAFLGTTFRACVAIILAEVIGQSKWSRFRDKPRPLKELQVYDEASRGAIGCFQLLKISFKHFRGNALALSAAIALTLSFTTGSFVQQAVSTMDCPKRTLTAQAFVKSSTAMPSMPFSQIPGTELVAGEISAVINGLINPNTQETYGVSGCSTSNCTFPKTEGVSHTTVGVCSLCRDLTDLVETTALGTWASDQNTNFVDLVAEASMPKLTTWGNAFDLQYSDAILDDLDEEMLDVARLSFVNVTLLAGMPKKCLNENDCGLYDDEADKSDQEVLYVGAMCSLYPCVQDFEATIVNNTLDMSVISSTPIPRNRQRHGDSSGVTALHERDFVVKSPCIVDGKVYDIGNFSDVPGTHDIFNNLSPLDESQRTLVDVDIDGSPTTVPSDCFYNIDPSWREVFSEHLNYTVFSWKVSGDYPEVRPANCVDHEGRGGILSCDGENWWLSNMWGYNQRPTFKHFEEKFDDLARALTNYFRAVGIEGRTANPAKLVGETDELTFCVHFDWPFLLFPAALYLVTLTVFITTLVQNYRDKRQCVWKTDILPLLFFGLERDRTDEQSSRSSQSEDIKHVIKAAEALPVILQPSATSGASVFLEVGKDYVINRKTSYSSQLNSDAGIGSVKGDITGRSQVYYSVAVQDQLYEGGPQDKAQPFTAQPFTAQARQIRRGTKIRPGDVQYRNIEV